MRPYIPTGIRTTCEASAVQPGTVVLAVITASGLVAAMQVERVLAVHGNFI